jgi:hypothetical protein
MHAIAHIAGHEKRENNSIEVKRRPSHAPDWIVFCLESAASSGVSLCPPGFAIDSREAAVILAAVA